MKYTFKEGFCSQCGATYKGWITDESPKENLCKIHRPIQEINRSIVLRSFAPYWDGGLGTYITSQRQRQSIIRKDGLVEVGNELDAMERTPEQAPHVTDDEFMLKVKEVQERFPSEQREGTD